MATFNASSADTLTSSVPVDNFERSNPSSTFILPSPTTSLQLDPFATASPHLVASMPLGNSHSTHHHQRTNSTSSYTFVHIKREPCQVSEVTTSNNCHQQQQTSTSSVRTATNIGSSATSSITASSSKTMSSTLTTLVKIEASSPKVIDVGKGPVATLTTTPCGLGSSNPVPIGIAVARKRPQESSTLSNSSTISMQQSINKDINCFGIRVADFGGVTSSCNNLYFTGSGDLMSGSSPEELGMNSGGVQNINRAQSINQSFWQYPSALPLESVISMSPATVGLQYSRDTSRGQVVLVPATAATLGISNFPLYTPTDPFQQAAAALVWPSWAHNNTSAATAITSPQNFIFPSTATTLQGQPYAASLQLFGSNYLTAAAAAAATLCQHNPQTNNSSMSSNNLSIGSSAFSVTGSAGTSNSNSINNRILGMSSAISALPPIDSQKQQKQHMPVPIPITPQSSLIVPPNMKIEDFHGVSEFMTTATKTTSTFSSSTPLHHLVEQPHAGIDIERENKSASISNSTTLINLQNSNSQALNLVRLPTPPTSETTETVGIPATQSQLLYQPEPTSSLLNLSITSNGSSTSLNETNITSKSHLDENNETLQQHVVNITKVNQTSKQPITSLTPQTQDVNIQTDTPICSEDENSSCPHMTVQITNSISTIPASDSYNSLPSVSHEQDICEQQPLELTKSNAEYINISNNQVETAVRTKCHSSEADKYRIEHSSYEQSFQTDLNHSEKTSICEDIQAVPQNTIECETSHVDRNSTEDLTGLELLSNISTSSLAKSNSNVRVKQEPIEHSDYNFKKQLLIKNTAVTQQVNEFDIPCTINQTINLHKSQLQSSTVEPLGGLNLLCSLAEQRLQEEVQNSNSELFLSQSNKTFKSNENKNTDDLSTFSLAKETLSSSLDHAFPSLEDIELPLTCSNLVSSVTESSKRRKHKHSKSLKLNQNNLMIGKKSTRCTKKSKKKYSKEKRRYNKELSNDLDFNDEQLQEELKSAFSSVNPKCKGYKWPNPKEIFNIMESNMRMRLADITRQYRKKKRKLEEITKNRKKKKCSKLIANQFQQQQVQASALLLGNQNGLPINSNNANGNLLTSVLPLSDYKFGKFSTSSGLSNSSTLLNPSFLRFTEKSNQTVAQFPPPDVDFNDETGEKVSIVSPCTYKPVRLEPSALSTALDNRNLCLGLVKKHSLSGSKTNLITVPAYKERKLMKMTSSVCSAHLNKSEESRIINVQTVGDFTRKTHQKDKELILTNEHLYQKETRVLTDMGGLFYAGIMKPLQPPDVYAITLDGERGNKSHIMSREEIFKDTILEVTPKNMESVPIGTRLCAYWSQQYRCLYPGRAIEPESSDDNETMKDFVSVEFDDGDSGRIRLQNIRFLLSDYPIVGKQKKTNMKSASIEVQQREEFSLMAEKNSRSTPPTRTVHQPTFDKISKRVEKKHNKNTTEVAISNNILPTNINNPADGSESKRKHHKRKKRKKHKKHHRKGLPIVENDKVEVNDANYEIEAVEICTEEIGFDSLNETCNTKKPTDETGVLLTSGAIKVKNVNLDLDEESASNLMSEISDEVKGEDEVEHNNSKGSKIAAFLPERQLWGWMGKAYRKAGVKGRARKQFYKAIKRGKETITVGDCAVFLSTGRPDRPYIGRIESMWETTSSNKIVRVRWFYHPEETIGCPNLTFPGALFESPHEDENDVQTISHHCEVLPFQRYFLKFGADSKQYQSIYDNNDTYYLAGYYNPRLQVLKLQDDIPTLEEQTTTEV
ncbi:protein winged eye isoform X2 [Teleopsis dalmanni]|uniref:protein winged eye isoform X2 n=1 Tax=Teleopsis dalmanni TaxID=139649 RepID=UPI0018CD1EF0|nr:protein winged eye isoform X2 [Teleopsis dalmanni]